MSERLDSSPLHEERRTSQSPSAPYVPAGGRQALIGHAGGIPSSRPTRSGERPLDGGGVVRCPAGHGVRDGRLPAATAASPAGGQSLRSTPQYSHPGTGEHDNDDASSFPSGRRASWSVWRRAFVSRGGTECAVKIGCQHCTIASSRGVAGLTSHVEGGRSRRVRQSGGGSSQPRPGRWPASCWAGATVEEIEGKGATMPIVARIAWGQWPPGGPLVPVCEVEEEGISCVFKTTSPIDPRVISRRVAREPPDSICVNSNFKLWLRLRFRRISNVVLHPRLGGRNMMMPFQLKFQVAWDRPEVRSREPCVTTQGTCLGYRLGPQGKGFLMDRTVLYPSSCRRWQPASPLLSARWLELARC